MVYVYATSMGGGKRKRKKKSSLLKWNVDETMKDVKNT